LISQFKQTSSKAGAVHCIFFPQSLEAFCLERWIILTQHYPQINSLAWVTLSDGLTPSPARSSNRLPEAHPEAKDEGRCLQLLAHWQAFYAAGRCFHRLTA
jgi:hypothetical protein